MAHKDTLTLYNELIANGIKEEQAQIQAKQLGAIGDELGISLKQIDSRLVAIDKDLFWMRLVGAGMIVTFFGNFIAIMVR